MQKKSLQILKWIAVSIVIGILAFLITLGVRSHLQKVKEENQTLQSGYNTTIKNESAGTSTSVTETQTKGSDTTTPHNTGKPQKVAYLTFDDGPSQYTDELLTILKSLHVHATFFVVGTSVEQYPDIVKKEAANGNAVGIHCWRHDYEVCYASVSAFFTDFNHIKTTLTNLLGAPPTICRFPGGTANTVSDKHGAHLMKKIVPEVTAMGITPFDWDVSSGDGASKQREPQTIANIVIKQAKACKNPVILCHDSKKNTIAAIPSIIARLKALGYTFDVLSPSAPPCQQNPV